ncbi:MAG: hypothetical protein IPI97_01055 [Nitrosomonas sp.]|jgi:hypothetical protein|nr:hypothetical protein [Nitrosomonas sp.]MBK7363658.1 hypothetical protein [Nitrosomonas sp.]
MAINHEQVNFDHSSFNQIKQSLQQAIKDKANSLRENHSSTGVSSFKEVLSKTVQDLLSNPSEKGINNGLSQTTQSSAPDRSIVPSRDVQPIQKLISSAADYLSMRLQKEEKHTTELATDGVLNNATVTSFLPANTGQNLAQKISSDESVHKINAELNSAAWLGGKPNSIKELLDFMQTRGIAMNVGEASDFLYGSIGANDDLRDFNTILNAENPTIANNQALGQLFSNPNARTNPNYTIRSTEEVVAQNGNLLVRESKNGAQILAAQAANGMPLTDIFNGATGVSGGIARYGITDANVQAILDNPKVSDEIKAQLKSYLGSGYQQNPTNYLLDINLASFATTGVFNQSK